jgi:hypothetical protein
MTGSWMKAVRMQPAVAREVAKGLRGTRKQVQYARYVDEVLGKYGRFSPATRRVIQTFAPFLPWYLNCGPVRVLPAAGSAPDHDGGAGPHGGDVPAGLAGEPRRPALGISRRRSRSAATGSCRWPGTRRSGAFTDAPASFADVLLPQASSVLQIMNGKSWTGQDLKTQNGQTPSNAQRTFMALYALAESTFPGVAIGRRLQERGETPFDDSTVWSPKTKPGIGSWEAGVRGRAEPGVQPAAACVPEPWVRVVGRGGSVWWAARFAGRDAGSAAAGSVDSRIGCAFDYGRPQRTAAGVAAACRRPRRRRLVAGQ